MLYLLFFFRDGYKLENYKIIGMYSYLIWPPSSIKVTNTNTV